VCACQPENNWTIVTGASDTFRWHSNQHQSKKKNKKKNKKTNNSKLLPILKAGAFSHGRVCSQLACLFGVAGGEVTRCTIHYMHSCFAYQSLSNNATTNLRAAIRGKAVITDAATGFRSFVHSLREGCKSLCGVCRVEVKIIDSKKLKKINKN